MTRIKGHQRAYHYIKKRTRRSHHIVQRKIPLAKVHGRPFDIRVMVQRRRGSRKWVVTGKLAKIAGPGYMITNTARSGGRVVPVSSAVRKSNIRGGSLSRIKRRMNRISRLSARQLHAQYPRLRIVGLDIGVDRSGKPWIIEANFLPSKAMFLRLKDKSDYRRIMRFS